MIPAVIAVIVALLATVQKIIEANGDPVEEENALMEAQEKIKAELDRRKFG